MKKLALLFSIIVLASGVCFAQTIGFTSVKCPKDCCSFASIHYSTGLGGNWNNPASAMMVIPLE